MFKYEFQGGQFVEVFSAQRKDPVSHWKVSGNSACNKVFEKDVKSYVYCLEGNNISTKMQLPKDSKQNLALQQKYLVLQVYIAKGEDFCLDIGILDSSNATKRRLVLSTTYKEIQITTLHTKLPMTLVKKSMWLNLCIDLSSLVSECWKGQTYKSLESICIGGNCKLRRIFTMKNQPPDTDDTELPGCPSANENMTALESIPRQCMLAPDLKHCTQVINMTKILYAEGKFSDSQNTTATELDASYNNNTKKHNDEYHIAFGKKVVGSAPQSHKGSSKDSERKGSGKDERRSAGKERDKEERRTSGKDREKDERRSSGRDRDRDERKGSGRDREKEERRGSGRDREREERKGSGRDREKEERRSSGKEREQEDIRSAGREREKEERKTSGKDRERRSAGKDSRTKEGRSHHSERYNHVRSISDSDAVRIPSPIEQEPTLDQIIALDSSQVSETSKRERRDSDPGASQNDPDLTVDKDSLRSSHTWTDGADGQESIPFVKPHPPSEPSSAKHRRPARVKSAGKERTPHAGHVFYKETKSPPSGLVQSGNLISSPAKSAAASLHQTNSGDVTPMMMANEAEMEDIFMAMQRSVHRQLSLEDDKNNTDSDYTSGAHDGETDSISEVIQTLNNKKIDDDITGEGEYEGSDDDDDNDQIQVYSFSSQPRQAPRTSRANETVTTSIKKHPINKTAVKSHRTRVRKKQKGGSLTKGETEIDSRKMGGGDAYPSSKNSGNKPINNSSIKTKSKNTSLSRSQADFLINGSSDEDSLPVRQATPQKRRSPRGRKKTVGKTPGQMSSQMILNSKIDSNTFKMDFSHSQDYLQIPISAHSPHLPDVDPGSNAMICSVSKNNLRAMTDKEVKLRQSGGTRHYNPKLYRMGSESMEHNMLINNMSDSGEEDNKDGTLTGRHGTLRLEGTDSDETETFNTLKPSSEKNDYMDEIGENIFLDDPYKTISDHRVFSPEIVLPSQKHRSNNDQHFDEEQHQHHSVTSSNSGYSSAEEELELLYDYILQCYYDPKTGIFYQLR